MRVYGGGREWIGKSLKLYCFEYPVMFSSPVRCQMAKSCEIVRDSSVERERASECETECIFYTRVGHNLIYQDVVV